MRFPVNLMQAISVVMRHSVSLQSVRYNVWRNKAFVSTLPRKFAMNAVRVETTVEANGELHLTALPCRRGDRVEVVINILEPSSRPDLDVDREIARTAALDQFLALARSSSFRSAGPYPTRHELHERR
jgi:hypothetical protein